MYYDRSMIVEMLTIVLPILVYSISRIRQSKKRIKYRVYPLRLIV